LQIEEAQNIVKDSNAESSNWKEKEVELLEENKKSNIKIEAQAIELETQAIEIGKLKHYVKLLTDAIYGKKSEKLNSEAIKQLGLLFNEAEGHSEDEQEELPIEATTSIKEHKRKKGRKKLPKDLPIKQIIYDLEEEEKKCSCGCQLSKIGEEKSEQLDFIPAKLQVIEHVRYKYACKGCEDTVKCAKLPNKPLPKANATAGLLAHIMVGKYTDHLPLYRQAEIFKRHGIDLPRSTLCNWVNASGKLIKPIIGLLKKDMIASDYVASDETTVRVLDNEASTSYMWVHLSGERDKRAIVYDYQDNRRGENAETFLQDFKGYHQTDAYSGYNGVHDREEITWVACWAHARRKYIEITKTIKEPGIAHKMVKYIGLLYKIEREALDKKLDPGEIKKLREEKAIPILGVIKKLVDEVKDATPPQSILGKAIRYTSNNWQGLNNYLLDGRLRIDNNDSERSIKPFAVGRKNWMFCATTKGAEASANIYSIIETCKATNINPYNYLKYLLNHIHDYSDPKDLVNLLPYNIDKKLLSD